MSIDRTWATQAIDTCIAHGIDHFFLAPGSRCTPLTLAVAQCESAQITQHFDERGLAFAALGYGRATAKPGVFICTSGTAVANAFPAVIEASMERVPMLLFTADRPPELRGTGANQTIDQRRIFGTYPRWFFEMPVPAADAGEVEDRLFVVEEVSRAIIAAKTGPTHLNWMFREPFTIDDSTRLTDPYSFEVEHELVPSPDPKIEVTGNALIVVGGCRPEEANAALALASHLDAPVVADVTSGLRCISADLPETGDLPNPDTIIHIGGRIVSKSWMKWTATLASIQPSTRFIHLTPYDITINPNHLKIEKHVTPLDGLPEKFSGDRTSPEFSNSWEQAEETRRVAMARVLQAERSLSEPAIAYNLSDNLLPGYALFIGNSTPIRDMDWYGSWPSSLDIVVAANRGASGIDGLIATSVGFAKGLQRTTTVLLGDLSALHDLNSLALVKQSAVPLIVLIINNQGGGIFDLLPVSKQTAHFEQFFVTPHSLGFKQAAEMFGLDYCRVTKLDEFTTTYKQACRDNSTIVIELITDRKYNMEVRHRINTEIQQWNDQN